MYIHETNVHNIKAASEVVPLIIEHFKPTSVLDVGCGIGTWLSVFKAMGVRDVAGVDGAYVDTGLLSQHLDLKNFAAKDLSKSFDLNRKYDVAISLEVAEHLPPSSGELFVDSICRHSDNVVFSAAVPHQGGQNHLNEQWPEYWIKLFNDRGYFCYDSLRPVIWDNKKVEWWYKQNILVFTKTEQNGVQEALTRVSVIHPDHFMQKIETIKNLQHQVQQLQVAVSNLAEGRNGVRIALHAVMAAIKNKVKS